MEYPSIEIKQIIEKSNIWRGEIINLVIILERKIDTFLLSYFSPHQPVQDEMMEMLVERITLENKRTSLIGALKKWNTSVLYRKKYKDLLNKDLPYIILQRNIFAHYSVSTSKSSIVKFPEEIGLIKFRDQAEILWYSQEKIDLIKEKVDKCYKIIDQAIVEFNSF